MTATKEQVLKALSQVIDPDFKRDIVSLKMVDDIQVDGNKISFTLILTTPACPLKDQFYSDSLQALKAVFGADISLEINFTSRTTTIRKDGPGVLPGVKNIICIASGKGGVGKSTVSVNLAVALSRAGAKVGLIDADIYGPSIPTMFGLLGRRPSVIEENGKHYIVPLKKFGIDLLSIGFLVDEKQAVAWRGPMISSALRQFVTDCKWGELDYLLIDMPPGTGDVHLTLVQTVPVTGALVVTTPQEVALADARKAIAMFQIPNINVPVIGVVENMSWFTPEELPENKYYLFGKDGGKKIAEEFQLPLLGQIPVYQGIREGGDLGNPISNQPDDLNSEAFLNLAENVARYVSINNQAAGAEKKEAQLN